MKIKTIITLICVIFCAMVLSTFQKSFAEDFFSFTIDSAKTKVKLGDAIFINLNITHAHPQVSAETSEPLPSVKYGNWVLCIQNNEANKPILYHLALPLRFKLKDAKGFQYSAEIEIFCHPSEEEEKLITKVIFDNPGFYTIQILNGKQISNKIDVSIEYSSLGEKGLALLTNPKDFAFLLGGLYKSPETIKHLTEVVNECKGTELAQRAAARLGLEYFIEFHRKHPSFEKFKDKRQKDKVEEPFFDLACKYLAIGVDLPDEFPIREKVLDGLFKTEFIKDNYEKIDILLDELEAKYPRGKYGRRVPRRRIELKRLKKQHSEQSKKDKDNNDVK